MADPFVAEIRIFPFNFAPRGWAWCDGQLLPLSQNTALFSHLGTTYGGNGITNFALPDLTGRVVVGAGSGPVLRGEQSGVQNQTLTQAQLPAHTHTLPGTSDLTGSTGGNQSFDNRQPSLGLNYIIATDPGHSLATTTTLLGQVGLFAGSFAPTFLRCPIRKPCDRPSVDPGRRLSNTFG